MDKNDLYATVAKTNFWAFCVFYDFDFFRVNRPFLYKIALAFQEIHEGKIQSLSVSMPPRAGKSYITSLFCAWLIGINPRGSVMRNSCTATLYRKFSYDVRDIVKSDKFKRVFPEVHLSDDKASVDGWNVKEAIQVSYFGNGVGGTIIGFGASEVAITDDLYRGHEDALSDTMNDKIHRWYESAHKSRLEKNCPTIDIGTRWSKNDIIGKQSSESLYDKEIIVPAMINGKSFCENVKTTEEYEKIKKTSGQMIWNSEYMQQPAEVEGAIFRMSLLKRYKELNDEGVNLIAIDTADEGGDHFSAPIGRLFNEKLYITDAIFNLVNLTINEGVSTERIQRHKIDRCYIETNSAGAYFKRNLVKLNPGVYIYGQFSKANKMSRIMSQSGWIMENVYFPENPNEELSRFMSQLCGITFKSTKNDDAADGLSMMSASVRRDFHL